MIVSPGRLMSSVRLGIPRSGLVAEHNFCVPNTIPNSDLISSTTWTRRGTCTITSNVASPVAPDGTATAELIQGLDIGANDFYYTRLAFGAVYKSWFEPSFYIKRVSTSGVVAVVNPSTDTYGSWTLDLSLLSDEWEIITKNHPAVSVLNNFRSNVGRHGLMFLKSSGTGTLSFHIWRACIVPGNFPATTPIKSDAQTSFVDLSGKSNTATLAGGTLVLINGLSFDGTDDRVTGLPAEDPAYTVVTFLPTAVHGVDSASGSYINGISAAGATKPNIGTAGGYAGIVGYRLQYNRVLSANEHRRIYRARRELVGSRYPWVAGGVVTFTVDDYKNDLAVALFASKGVSGNHAIVTDLIGTGSGSEARYNVAELQALYASGWRFVSHTKTHPDLRTLNDAQLHDELGGSKAALEAIIGQPIKFLAYPNGLYNATVSAVASQYYVLARKSINQINYPPNDMDWMEWRGWVADDHTKLAEYQAAVDAAFTGNGWLDFHFHAWTADDVTTIGTLIDYILAKPMPILTWEEALEVITNPLLR